MEAILELLIVGIIVIVAAAFDFRIKDIGKRAPAYSTASQLIQQQCCMKIANPPLKPQLSKITKIAKRRTFRNAASYPFP